MQSGFHHGAAWLLAAASFAALLLLQAADRGRAPLPVVPATVAVPSPRHERLDRHEFEENVPDTADDSVEVRPAGCA